MRTTWLRTFWQRRLWRELRAAWVTLTGTGAATSVAFGLLVFASVLASLAIPRESVALRTQALHSVIAVSPLADRTVIAEEAEANIVSLDPTVSAAQMAAMGASVRTQLAADKIPLASDPPAWESLTTGFDPVSGAARAAGDGQPEFELAYRTALGSYSRIVAGRLPVGGSDGAHGAEVDAAVTTATAARFGLRVGSRVTVGPVQLVITGIIAPVNPASAFWSQDLVAGRPELTPADYPHPSYWVGAVFIGPVGLTLIQGWLGTSENELTWVYPAALSGLTAGQAGGLAAGVSSLVANGVTYLFPTGPLSLSIESQINWILSPFLTAESAVDPVLELLYVSLAVMGAVVVLLGARLVAQRRTAEFTLIRARGASLYQLGLLVLRANAVIAVIAGAAATVLALLLTPGDGDPTGWWLAVFAIAVALVGPLLISVVPQRVAAPVGGRPRHRAGGRWPAARRIVIETALLALSVGGLVVLHNEGVSSGNNSLYTSTAPVLLSIPVAVVVLRVYPLLVRELARLAGLTRGVVAFVGLARATRTPAGTILPSFALVLVLAMVAFPDMVSTSVTGSEVAASWQQVGADAIITAPPGAVITPALQRQLSSVPGVTSTAAAVVEPGTLPAGFELPVVFVDPAQYAAVVDHAPGPRFPLAGLSANGGSGGQAAVFPALATSAAYQLVGKAPTSLTVGSGSVTIRLAGSVSSVPGVTADAVLLVPMSALGPSPPGPSLLLVAGSGLDAAQLTADVQRALPGGSVTLRGPVLTALTTAPVPQAAQSALTLGMATAAGFGALVLLLSLLLTAQTREMTLARLATMGLRRWQAQLLLATETLPPVVAAAGGGVACAWLLAPLVGPSLNLSGFSGTGSVDVVTPAASPLFAAAVGLVLAALLLMAASAVITYHRGSARALRIAD
jgi:putative ABC transport system permease protein